MRYGVAVLFILLSTSLYAEPAPRLHRMVDGMRVFLSPAEEAAQRAEWAASLAARPTPAQRKDVIKERRLNDATIEAMIEVLAGQLNIQPATLRAEIKAKMIVP